MRPAVLFLSGLLLGACASLNDAAVPLKSPTEAKSEFVKSLESKTVALVSLNGNGVVAAHCSGVWVAKELIVTASHCVKSELPEVPLYVVHADVLDSRTGDLRGDIEVRVALVVTKDVEHDLALLKAVEPSKHAVASVSVRPRVGQSVWTMGHPVGLWWTYSSGEVSAIRSLDLDAKGASTRYIQSTAPISSGNSGCGLFDGDGALVGITHGTFTRGQNLNLFIDAEYVGQLLGSYSKDRK